MKNAASAFLGGLVGTVAFLVVATYWLGHPFGDWFMSAHGLLGATQSSQLAADERLQIYKLLNRGLIVTTDGILSQMADLYGNLIQVLIGGFVVVTALGLFAVRWQSIQAAQEYVESKAKDHFKSSEFQRLVQANVVQYVDSLDPEMNPSVFTGGNQGVNNEITSLKARLDLLERAISQQASAEEPEDNDEN